MAENVRFSGISSEEESKDQVYIFEIHWHWLSVIGTLNMFSWNLIPWNLFYFASSVILLTRLLCYLDTFVTLLGKLPCYTVTTLALLPVSPCNLMYVLTLIKHLCSVIIALLLTV